MKGNHAVFTTAAATLALVTLVGGSRVWAEEEHPAHRATQEGSSLSMSKFYSGSDAQIGTFPGKLVCLRCDLKPGPEMMKRCQKEGHRHALSMEADSMIHPLLAGTEEVLKQINSGELHGKEVTVHGKHYPSTGAILVDRISAAKE